MNQPKKIVLWLRVIYLFQMVLILLIWIVFTRRIFAVAGGIRHSLYNSDVAVTQVDKVNQAFSSITHDLSWIALSGMILTGVGFTLLVRIAKKGWSKPNSHGEVVDQQPIRGN